MLNKIFNIFRVNNFSNNISNFVETVIGSKIKVCWMDGNPDELQDYYYNIDYIEEVEDYYILHVYDNSFTLKFTNLHDIEDIVNGKKYNYYKSTITIITIENV